MSLNTYVSSAWEEIADLQCPEVDGARETADSAYTYVDGAWEEVWTDIHWLKELANTTTVASTNYTTGSDYDGDQWCIYATDNDGGYITYYLDGDFSNPTFRFNWDGTYYGSLSNGTIRYASAGQIDVYTRTKSGTENYKTVVSQLGNSTAQRLEGVYEESLSGDFDRVGFRVKLHNWSLNTPIMYWIDIFDIQINGEQCLPGEECVK